MLQNLSHKAMSTKNNQNYFNGAYIKFYVKAPKSNPVTQDTETKDY